MPDRQIPRPSSVLVTIEPGEALSARVERDLAPAEPPPAFRILRTTQVDGYEEAAPVAPGVLTMQRSTETDPGSS